MSGRDLIWFLTLALLPGSVSEASGNSLPEEPQETGSLLLAGRLPWGASGLPTGEVLAPCEDQTLSVIDDQAKVLTQWKAGGRFCGPVTVGPRSSYQLLAAPQTSGRVDVLVWDPRTKVLAVSYSPTHPSEVAATAWNASGSLAVAWRDGRLEAWTPHGTLQWGVSLGFPLGELLVDDSAGTYAFGPGQVALVDTVGAVVARWALPGTPRGVVQSLAGDLYAWTDQGLWVKAIDAPGFKLFDPSSRILGVVIDRLGHLVLTEPERLRRVTAAGVLLSVTVLPRPATVASVLDDRGRILVGTATALEVWTYDGRFLGTLGNQPASSVLVTERGLGVWSGVDWKVHVWGGFRWSPFGWSELGGGPERSFSARRPVSVATRVANWSDDPNFGYFYQLAASGEESKQREVLERFEAKSAQGDLLAAWPFANVVLLKLCRSGLTDLEMDHTRVRNNWPELRLRGFALLAKTVGPEDRDELLSLLQKEFDPAVAAVGVQALAQSGWDGDGKIMHLLSTVQGRMADQASVANAVIDAARFLWVANGRSTDPSLLSLVSAVFQGPYPRALKQKAQTFFQDLIEAS